MNPVEMTVNGAHHLLEVEPRRTLAEVLREDLSLTGTHLGCEHGVCGACTVLVDGEPVRSCLVLGVQAQGAAGTTVEGVGAPDNLSPVQQGFLESVSFQCGFCTPGIVMAITAWFAERRRQGQGAPTDDEIREALAANLCRCTGYQAVVAGVARAWELEEAARSAHSSHETTGEEG